MRSSQREAAWAGIFYPSDPKELRGAILQYIEDAGEQEVGSPVIGLVAPHAGYIYSGPVAAYAYGALRGKTYRRVVILAPSHRVALRGASVWPRGSYETPLGSISIDEEAAQRLLSSGRGLVVDEPAAHTKEHALEVQLPFLQVVLPSFRLLPLILGSHELHFARDLAALLKESIGTDETLYVASSDLSHYHEYARAVEIDRLLLETLQKLENERLAGALERGETEACGAGPILTVATLSRDHCDGEAKLLQYANSGDTAGTKEQVVGYASFLFSREKLS